MIVIVPKAYLFINGRLRKDCCFSVNIK